MATHTAIRLTTESYQYSDDALALTGILERVEERIHRLELCFGRERLLNTIAEVDVEELSLLVERYRVIVRTGQWPNEVRPTPFATFCREYERATLAYIDVGFDGLTFLAGEGSRSLSDIFFRVAASEALRGQFGKRSPNGLDRRLDDTVDALELCMLVAFGGDALNERINLLCTPTAPRLSAEAALLEDFAALRKSFPSPPSIREIVNADSKQQEIVWTFLRRHARWSVACMRNCYKHFSAPTFDEWLIKGNQQRASLAMRRSDLVADIYHGVGKGAASEIMRLASEVTILNELNLALEPCFSFKGGPGVPHGLIFRASASAKLGLQMAQDRLVNDKWDLFYSTTLTGE